MKLTKLSTFDILTNRCYDNNYQIFTTLIEFDAFGWHNFPLIIDLTHYWVNL